MKVLQINDFNNHTLKEDAIIRRIISGESELYEILVRRNNQKLYRIIRSYLKDEVVIEDVMQNTYVKAYTKLHQFKLDASFSTWLVRIGINEALAEIKEHKKLYNLSTHSINFRGNDTIEIPDTNDLNPQDKMISNETKHLLELSIDQLETKYKAVYILKEVEEMSLKEIAITLDLTVANVKIRLHRSKEMLKEKLFEISNDKNIFEFGFSRCDRITENVMSRIL